MNLKIKSKKLSISWKIFFFLSIFTYLSIGIYLLLNYLYLEKYQINKRKNILLKLEQNYEKIPEDEFVGTLEEEGIFFKRKSIEKTVSDKHIDKELLLELNYQDEVMGIIEGKDKIKRITFLKKINEEELIFLMAPLTSIKSILNISFQFYIFLVIGSIPINLLIAYILSMKMGRPIEKELLELNEQLRKELEKEKKLEDFRKKFISNISHELKTPISIISGYSDAIIDGIIKEDEINEICRNINLEASNMDNLIRELLFYAKLESGYIKLDKKEIDLQKLIEKLLKRYELDINLKNLKIEKILSERKIISDEKLLERALNNIFINAISYVDESKKIRIFLEEKKIKISNSFKGEENINFEEYFIPFNRNKKNQNQKYGGTGLGLSIISEILNLLEMKYRFFYDKEECIFEIEF